jgi:hypothetical protein
VYSTFLINAVPGIDRQVPVFVYPRRRNLQKIEEELKRIQQVYGLSDIYLYQSETEYSAICLRTFPLSRLRKIIGASTSTNYGTLLKYHQLFFRVGETRDANGTLCAGAPVYQKTIPGHGNNGHYVSRPHYRFLSDFLPLEDYPRMHGEGEVCLTHTVIEDT